MGSIVLRALLLLVVVAIAAGGFLFWRSKQSPPTVGAARPAAGATPKPMPSLPAMAPDFNAADFDPTVVYPFAKRLLKVNEMAHKRIVTNAEFHDSDDGDRYYTAVVTSCKDLDALWSISKGVLAAKVEQPLHLKEDFPTFTFVEYFQQGQWGVLSCDGTT
jgi:hypothetical protein